MARSVFFNTTPRIYTDGMETSALKESLAVEHLLATSELKKAPRIRLLRPRGGMVRDVCLHSCGATLQGEESREISENPLKSKPKSVKSS